MLASSSREPSLSRATVATKPGHRGEHEVSRNPSRRESRIASAGPVCSCALLRTYLHTRPRVQRASGFPCALYFEGGRKVYAKLGRLTPRERGLTSSRCGRKRVKTKTGA